LGTAAILFPAGAAAAVTDGRGQASSRSAGVSSTFPGDADCDGCLARTDLGVLLAAPFCDACDECSGKDANQDGLHSAADLTAFVTLHAQSIEVFPANGAVVSEPQVTFVITVQDPSGVTGVTCAGIEATPGDGDFACTVPLEPGPNPIEIVTTDACENQSHIDVVIEFDPPPVVAINSPDDGDVFLRGPIEVIGMVSDPSAEVRVNGVLATGASVFEATVPVRKGENRLRAVARDAAGGEGTDSVEVTVLTEGLGPTVNLTSPASGFLLGGPSASTTVPVLGRIRVGGAFSPGNAPTVSVNGVAATVRQSNSPGLFCASLGICWWDFSTSLVLSTADNPHVIRAVGTDRLGRTDSDSVTGNVDRCLEGTADGNAIAGASAGQANRCHEIDGCSTPEFLAPDVQDPAMGELGHRDTDFGKDTSDEEFAPHGAAPKDDLPCNHHDVCYQTCGANKAACDNKMFDRMEEVCRTAYPEKTCPYSPDLMTCSQWRAERDNCFRWARRYRVGLSSPPALTRFNRRQDEYCF
jgi:hypothetical protein